MKGVFITGTDTGVGKTIVTGLLGRYLSEKGYNVITQKWIQTGGKGLSRDIYLHLRLMKKERQDIKYFLPHMSPYLFKFSSSPHLAAYIEKKKIYAERIKQSFRFLSTRFDFVIVEGIGGALVPFNKKKLVIDIAKELNLPVLIITQNKIGAINHTLLTIETIKKRDMSIMGIIFNSPPKKVNRIISRDNPRIIKTLTGATILGSLPYFKDSNRLYKEFIPIGKRIATHLNLRNKKKIPK